MAAPIPVRSPEYLAQDIGPMLVATSSIFIFLSTVFVALRYYARYLTQTRFGAEDVIMPFAWLAQIGLCVTGIAMVKKAGTGRHLDYVAATDPLMIMEHFKGIMVHEILHLPAVAFPKLCVALLYLRVFTNKWARIATWVLIVTIAATWFSYTVAAMFQCVPFNFNWDKSNPDGRCFNVALFAASSSIPNIVTDVAVLFLPIRTIMDLKVSIGRRIGLLLIFLTGSIGIVASIIRTIVFSNIDPLDDATYKHVELINWTIIEPGLYLLAACALSFKPLFRMFAKALHLDTFITHSKSAAGRTGTKPKSSSANSGIHLDTIKSSHAGFHQLKSPLPVGVNGAPGNTEDMDFGCKGDLEAGKEIRIIVTRTSDVEEWKDRGRYSNGSYDDAVGHAI